MAVGDAYVFPGFPTPVLTQLSKAMMFCVLKTNHARFAKETSANFRNIQH